MSTRVYEDFFDDNAGQLQTSLKGLSDELDSPMDYDYRMILLDDIIEYGDRMQFEETKEKVESILATTFIEFSDVYRRCDIETVSEYDKK